MPIEGKDAFLSKMTFRRESKWYSKTKQEFKDMKTIEERAKEYAWSVWPNPMFAQEWEECKDNYIAGAKEQKAIDDVKAKEAFNKVCGWLSTYSWFNEVFEKFMKNLEE